MRAVPDSAAEGSSSNSSCAKVTEYVMLVRFQPGTNEEATSTAVDSLWSLQYMVPHVLCATAGPVVECEPSGGGWEYAVHFRFGRTADLQAFLAHPLVQQTYREQRQGEVADTMEFAFEGAVDKSLESLFRRGGQWAEGLQLVMLWERDQDIPQHSSQIHQALPGLQAVAYSSRFGALQTSAGALALKRHSASATQSSACSGEVLMCNFEEADQWREFVQQEEIKALQSVEFPGNEKCQLSFAFHVSPASDSKARSSSAVQWGK